MYDRGETTQGVEMDVRDSLRERAALSTLPSLRPLRHDVRARLAVVALSLGASTCLAVVFASLFRLAN
jgi:hypothetical protein